jgi:hypothetical protein
LHALLQPPQCSAVAAVSTHWPPQQVIPALPSRRHASADFIEQTYVGRGGWTVPPTSRKRLLLAGRGGLALMAVAVASTAKRRRAAFDIVERRKSNVSVWLIIGSLLLVK